MSPRAAAMIVGSALLLALVAAVGWWQMRETGDSAAGPEAAVLGPGGGLPVDVYFPGTGSRLVVERREIPPGETTDERVHSLLAEVLAGPSTSEGVRALPPDTELGDLYLAPGGVVYVDFSVPGQGAPPPSGSLAERLTVYSLVNTIELNLPEVTSVVLLWNGRQRESFAGHVDTTRPLTADTRLAPE